MLDVFHFLFESDMNHSTAEQSEAQTKTRTNLYRDLYGTTYQYGPTSSGKTYVDKDVVDEPFVADEIPKPFNPRANKPKPFVQPTKFNPDAADPFNGVLDAPIN